MWEALQFAQRRASKMECVNPGKSMATAKDILVSFCIQTVKKVGYLFNKGSITSVPTNSLPSTIAFSFGALDDGSQGAALVESLSNLCGWCSELGIRSVLAYDKAGTMHMSVFKPIHTPFGIRAITY